MEYFMEKMSSRRRLSRASAPSSAPSSAASASASASARRGVKHHRYRPSYCLLIIGAFLLSYLHAASATFITPDAIGDNNNGDKSNDNRNDNSNDNGDNNSNGESNNNDNNNNRDEINRTDESQAKVRQRQLSHLHADPIEDSFFDPLSVDPSCNDNDSDSNNNSNNDNSNSNSNSNNADCYAPPESTIETETILDATCLNGGGGDDDPSSSSEGSQDETTCGIEMQMQAKVVDKHWGSDPKILKMRDKLRRAGSGASNNKNNNNKKPLPNRRPPIFLMPGLASTRLVAWKFKKCMGAFSSDIKVQDNVWLNINLILQMGTLNVECMKECLSLGLNQTDTDDLTVGCKLRPDEGLDAIGSLAPGGLGSSLLVGGTNTVYAWLIQWLADNLGYDVTNIIGLPYDWRLSPDRMEKRDGFLTMTRRRIEAAVATNGEPGIMVAHSMGNLIFRYFIEWLRVEMRQEAYRNYVKRAKKRAQTMMQKKAGAKETWAPDSYTAFAASYLPGWMNGVVSSFDELYEWITSDYEEPLSYNNHNNHNHKHNNNEGNGDYSEGKRHAQLWELAISEGDANWLEWLETHIWTFVGLSAPMLGAVNPLRSVISGENMGLPLSDELAREMEVTFGSTHTINPVTSKTGFCDDWEASQWDEEDESKQRDDANRKLACLDDIMNDIEMSTKLRDPWKDFPTLKGLLRERVDWDSGKPMIDIEIEHCQAKNKPPCVRKERVHIGPKDVQTGDIFTIFSQLWKEENDPLIVKRDQLYESFMSTKVPNILNSTWDRPLIKHVIMAYGVDIPTEVGYIYSKKIPSEEAGPGSSTKSKTESNLPTLKTILWEEPRGRLTEEKVDAKASLTDVFILKKAKHEILQGAAEKSLPHSGDGSVPYLSLAWAHTWLLHAARAKRFSEDDPQQDRKNALNHIDISHRPQGAAEWVDGPPPKQIDIGDDRKMVDEADTGTSHPHGTRYKPEMVRYHNVGISRTTGIEYTTTIIEAIGVEHKETTRNYDILAAVFTDALKYMHDDFGLLEVDKQN